MEEFGERVHANVERGQSGKISCSVSYEVSRPVGELDRDESIRLTAALFEQLRGLYPMAEKLIEEVK